MLLSFEKKCSIFESFPELKKKKGSNNRINFEFKGSKVKSKNVGIQLTTSGKGSVVGKYLSETIAKKYELDAKDDIDITKFNEDRLRTIIQEVIDSMNNPRNCSGEIY